MDSWPMVGNFITRRGGEHEMLGVLVHGASGSLYLVWDVGPFGFRIEDVEKTAATYDYPKDLTMPSGARFTLANEAKMSSRYGEVIVQLRRKHGLPDSPRGPTKEFRFEEEGW